jgi:cytochrome c peroxidase
VSIKVCDAANVVRTTNDVASSMGVKFGKFRDIPPIGTSSFGPATLGVAPLAPDLRSLNAADNVDPIPGFAGNLPATDPNYGHQFRRVEPRNTPTFFAAALNFDNFWDGRARHDFNGGSVFGAADPQPHVFVHAPAGTITPTRQIIRFASIASLAMGPGLSKFEMSFDGRNWAKIGKKFLQYTAPYGLAKDPAVTPLANQLVDPTDSVLGPWSNQGGSKCASLGAAPNSYPNSVDKSPGWSAAGVAGRPGLCISYQGLIKKAFYPPLWSNNSQYLVGAPDPSDPFDGYSLKVASCTNCPPNTGANRTNTNNFSQMEANFTLFYGLGLHVWTQLLMPDNTPWDQFIETNPDMFASIGEVGEPGLVGPLPLCTTANQRFCFKELGNFKRDSAFADPNANNCMFLASGEGSTTFVPIGPCKGTRTPKSNEPDPLLGMDIFQGSNFSLKNPNFRAARCAECHAGGTFTDNTVPFTFKAQLGDFIGEFTSPGTEALIEPLGRTRVITGFFLESEFNENGQDGVERRTANQSIIPSPNNGNAYPDGLLNPDGTAFSFTNNQKYYGSGQSFFDNGVYNIGVTPCEAGPSVVTSRCDDIGRGGTDAFGWPLSLAALMLKNYGGRNDGSFTPCTGPGDCLTEPGAPLKNFDPKAGCPATNPACVNSTGGLFGDTAQDQQINPGQEGLPRFPLLPAYYAPWANQINVGDAMPDLDEVSGGLNTLTNVAILEGFLDSLGPFNPAALLNESYSSGEGPFEGTWPIVNRVGRMGSVKAPQLREVELTGPYFHNGGKLTLRQVVDFYGRGGDFPVTNQTHRDFNIFNLNIEVQSNLTEEEKVALVDFLLELTDDRVRFEKAPFDRPQSILPFDGSAAENTGGRASMLGGCTSTAKSAALAPGATECAGGTFVNLPAVGASGNAAPVPSFLNIVGVGGALDPQNRPRQRLVGPAANCGDNVTSHYCR